MPDYRGRQAPPGLTAPGNSARARPMIDTGRMPGSRSILDAVLGAAGGRFGGFGGGLGGAVPSINVASLVDRFRGGGLGGIPPQHGGTIAGLIGSMGPKPPGMAPPFMGHQVGQMISGFPGFGGGFPAMHPGAPHTMPVGHMIPMIPPRPPTMGTGPFNPQRLPPPAAPAAPPVARPIRRFPPGMTVGGRSTY